MKEKNFKRIYIEITNVCNLKCSFCPETKRKKEFMSVENFRKIASQVKDYTNSIALHVKGEPLMHPDLNEILKICDDFGLKVNITTNATLLKENTKILINNPAVRQLNLSLHSITQNKDLSFKNYLDECLDCSKEILENSDIILSYRLWNLENIQENSENTEILEKLGNFFDIENLQEKARESKFLQLKKNAFLNQDIEFEWPSLESEIISEEGSCLGLRDQIAILVDGTVVPCCLDQEGDINLGNILNQNLEEILNSDASKVIAEGFRKRILIHNLCQRCGFRSNRKI